MLQFRFRIFSQCLRLEIQCFQCHTILSTILNISCSASPEPGQALLLFHKNCCSSSTDRAERRISSGAAVSWHVAMSSNGLALFVAMADHGRSKTRQCILACPARTSRNQARTARNQHPARPMRNKRGNLK